VHLSSEIHDEAALPLITTLKAAREKDEGGFVLGYYTEISIKYILPILLDTAAEKVVQRAEEMRIIPWTLNIWIALDEDQYVEIREQKENAVHAIRDTGMENPENVWLDETKKSFPVSIDGLYYTLVRVEWDCNTAMSCSAIYLIDETAPVTDPAKAFKALLTYRMAQEEFNILKLTYQRYELKAYYLVQTISNLLDIIREVAPRTAVSLLKGENPYLQAALGTILSFYDLPRLLEMGFLMSENARLQAQVDDVLQMARREPETIAYPYTYASLKWYTASPLQYEIDHYYELVANVELERQNPINQYKNLFESVAEILIDEMASGLPLSDLINIERAAQEALKADALADAFFEEYKPLEEFAAKRKQKREELLASLYSVALDAAYIAAVGEVMADMYLPPSYQPEITGGPLDGADNESVVPLLDWSDVEDADSYDVQIKMIVEGKDIITKKTSKTIESDSLIYWVRDLTSSEYVMPAGILKPGATYSWQVRAVNLGGATPWTKKKQFTTTTAAFPYVEEADIFIDADAEVEDSTSFSLYNLGGSDLTYLISAQGLEDRISIVPVKGILGPGSQQVVAVFFDAKGWTLDQAESTISIVTNENSISLPLKIYTPSNVTSEKEQEIPTEISVSQNYPNPFNSTTTISYALPASVPVTLKVFDATGREVATLVEDHQAAGEYEIPFEVGDLPSGTYFYRLKAGAYEETKAMLLIK